MLPGSIGITGGIGSGKSLVCSYLASLCQLPVVDLDQICRQLLATGQPAWQELKKKLPQHFFHSTGELDRKIFRQALFADEQLRNLVNAVVHPLARDEMISQMSQVGDTLLLEIPLLFEAGWQGYLQRIIVVYADVAVQCRRIVLRDHVSYEQARQSVSVQQCLLEKALQAHHVIDNSGSWSESCLQVRHLAGCLACRKEAF